MIAFTASESRRTVWVALLFVALTALLAFPLSVRAADHVMSASGDTNLFMWTLAWDVHAFTHQPVRIFDANIYYPLPRTLAYSENLIGSALLAAPILWFTDNLVLVMNLVSLLSAALCALGAYALGRQIGLGAGAAIVCGLVYGFAPPRFLRLDQLHLATLQWVPFALASLHAYFDGGRPLHLRLAAAFFTLQALSSGHGVAFLMIAAGGLVVFRFATGDRIDPLRRLRDFGVTGAVLVAPTLVAFSQYLIVQREAGLRRTLDTWNFRGTSFFASPSHFHQWVLSWIPGARINETADAYLFPGFVPIALGLCGIAAIWSPSLRVGADDRRALVDRRTVWFYLLLTLVGVWLTLPRSIGLWPLVYWLPGFNFIRVPSRFMLLAILGLAVLAGFGVEVLARCAAGADPRRAVAVRALPIAIGVLMVAESFTAPLGLEPLRVEIPAIDRWLATRPKPFVVAEVPLPDPGNIYTWEIRQTTLMLHSTAHWQKTVHGYSGLRLPLHVELYDELTRFPDEKSLASLERLGVTYVVMHMDWYSPGDRADAELRLSQFRDRLRLQHIEGEGRVYALISGLKRRESR